jgi:hypothetical protein
MCEEKKSDVVPKNSVAKKLNEGGCLLVALLVCFLRVAVFLLLIVDSIWLFAVLIQEPQLLLLLFKVMVCCFSAAPVEGDLRANRPNKFQVSLINGTSKHC